MKKKILIISPIILVLGIVFISIANLNFKGKEPELECVKNEMSASSGFSNPEKNNCPVTVESMNRWAEWKKQTPGQKILRKLGQVMIVAGFLATIIGAIMVGIDASKKKKHGVKRKNHDLNQSATHSEATTKSKKIDSEKSDKNQVNKSQKSK